ncbi:TetR/AcrR family transcriptional regulator [Nocardia sp. NPDC055049]
MDATERREQVLVAAVCAFAETGYAAARSGDIAGRAGVSQTYVFRLFGSKKQLFLAAVCRACDRLEVGFVARSQATPDAGANSRLDAVTEACRALCCNEPELLLVLLHGLSASGDPVIGDALRSRVGRVYELFREVTGADVSQARTFMSTGALLSIMAAMRVIEPNAVTTAWAKEIMTSLESEPAVSRVRSTI